MGCPINCQRSSSDHPHGPSRVAQSLLPTFFLASLGRTRLQQTLHGERQRFRESRLSQCSSLPRGPHPLRPAALDLSLHRGEHFLDQSNIHVMSYTLGFIPIEVLCCPRTRIQKDSSHCLMHWDTTGTETVFDYANFLTYVLYGLDFQHLVCLAARIVVLRHVLPNFTGHRFWFPRTEFFSSLTLRN